MEWIRQKDATEQSLAFQINAGGKSATITFEHHGEKYQVHVPYDKSLIRKMSNSKVNLVDNEGQSRDISQKPGIPYLVTSDQLGGEKIIIDDEHHIDKHIIPEIKKGN
jgi:hypothetical protein